MTDQTLPTPDFGSVEDTPRRLSIICSKGSLDMAYPGLIMANAAVGEGIETNLFFTFWGLDIITTSRTDRLGFTPLGNPATHMPQSLMWLPGVAAASGWMMRRRIAAQGVPPVGAFLDLLHASGAHLWGCKMSADMFGLQLEDLHEGVEDIISATRFTELSEGAQTIFI